MSDTAFPTINVAPIQQGLRDLGDALQQNQRIQDSLDATKATMALDSSWNDQIQNLKDSGDYSGDWGHDQREFVQQNIAGQEANFSNPRAYQAWAAQQGLAYEQHIPQVRAMQSLAQSNYCQNQTIDASTTAADKATAGDLSGIKDFNTWAGTTAVGQTVSFSPSYLAGFKDANGQIDTAKAHQVWQKTQDQTAGQYIGSQLDNIMNADAPAAQKLANLQALQKNAFDTLQTNNVYLSSGMRKGIEEQMTQAQTQLTKQAYTENVQGWYLKGDQLLAPATEQSSLAKATKSEYYPQQLVSWFNQNKDQMPEEVQKTFMEQIDSLSRAGEKGTGTTPDVNNTNAQGQAIFDYITGMQKTGASPSDIQDAINQMNSKQGYQGYSLQGATLNGKPLTFTDVTNKANDTRNLFQETHPDVMKAINDQIDEKTVPGQYGSIVSNIMEEIGGFNARGNSSYFDPNSGAPKMDKINSLISTVKNEAINKGINGILNNPGGLFGIGAKHNLVASEDDATNFVKQAQTGAGLADFTRADLTPQPGGGLKNPLLNAFTSQLQTMFKSRIGAPQATSWSQGTKYGVPMFLYNGKWYQPSVDGPSDTLTFPEVQGPNPIPRK